MYAVILLSRAEAELESQLDYLSERSPQGAEAWTAEYSSAIYRISDDPKSCGLAPENDDHEEEIRQVMFKTRKGNPYRLVFTIRGEEVYVFSIRGLGQDFSDF